MLSTILAFKALTTRNRHDLTRVEMILVDTKQRPLFEVRRFLPQPYPVGSFYDVLERFGGILIRASDFPAHHQEQGGSDAYCPVLLSKLVLLQRHHSWSDRETVHRARCDMAVKAALGLGLDQDGPSQPTLCRHRLKMQQRQLDQLYMERLLHLLRTLNLVQKDEAVAVDSMPIDGAGQVLDTYNLLGAGIRLALRRLGEHTGQGTAQVAKRLGMLVYLERSIKGNSGLGIDWESEQGRRALLEKLVQDALRLQQEMSQAAPVSAKPEPATDSGAAELPPEPADDGGAAAAPSCGSDCPNAAPQAVSPLQQSCAQLEQILLHDVEFCADGKVLGIRQQAAGDRLISVTDPDMRHGRKSASVLIAGYKVQVVASVLLGFILLTRVMRANRPDGQALPRMLDALRARGFLPKAVLGDHAYGTLANHHDIQQRRQQGQHIELYARMPRPENGGRLTKDQFEVDFEKRQLRCPSGQLQPLSRYASRDGRSGWLFEFPAATCRSCPLQKQCVSPKSQDGARSVFVVPEDERLIRAHLVRRRELDFVAVLAERPVVERVQAGLVQCGAKTVHRVGLAAVDFDVALSALTHNLRRLGSLLKQRPELLAQLQQEADRQKEVQRLLIMCLLLAALWLRQCRRASAVPAVRVWGCVRANFLLTG